MKKEWDQNRWTMKTAIDKVQCVVVGAGVVGLACAKRMAELGFDTVVLEKAGLIGSGNHRCQK